MNCSHCGAELPSRPRARMMISGVLFVAAAVLLVLLVRLPVTVLASVLMLVVGTSFFKGAAKAKALRCPSCKRLPARH